MTGTTEGTDEGAAEFAALFASLPAALKLRGPQQYWPRSIYHFTDVLNVPAILGAGGITCRGNLAAGSFADTSSHGITERTDYAHGYVRLYFRPVTPMQYGSEGFKPERAITEGRHWPMPVFFIFDAGLACARPGIEFTNGNFADSAAMKGSGIDFLKGLPFEWIYGNGAYLPEVTWKSRFHRQAEILVPGTLDFEDMQAIVCRTAAERDTLIDILAPDLVKRYGDMIRVVDPRETMFTNRFAFVRSLVWAPAGINLHMSPAHGPFNYRYRLSTVKSGRVLKENASTIDRIQPKHTIDFTAPSLASVHMCFEIDGHVAFSGVVTKSSLVGTGRMPD